MKSQRSFDRALLEELHVEKPTLPRRRKVPRCLDDGAAPAFHDTVEKHYHVIFFEVLDLLYNRSIRLQNLWQSASTPS